MDFRGLVLSILNESPDGIGFGGKEYYYDRLDGNPIAFAIDELMICYDIENNWDEKRDEPNSEELGVGKVVVYGKSSQSKATTWSHTEMLETLSLMENPYTDANKLDIYFFSPQFDLEGRLDGIAQNYPNMSVYTKRTVETLPANQTGRMWKIGKKVVVSLWDDDQDMMKNYVLPLVRKIYPKVLPDDILIEDQMTDTFYPSSKVGLQQTQKQPYHKELSELQRQLHLTSGDTQKRNQIIKRIVEICNEHGLDPKKFGISDEVLKSSELYAQKVMGSSKEPLIATKQKVQTSESLLSKINGKTIRKRQI